MSEVCLAPEDSKPEITFSDHPAGNNKWISYYNWRTNETLAIDFFHDPDLKWSVRGLEQRFGGSPTSEWIANNPDPFKRR
jgi:hypothetical protein